MEATITAESAFSDDPTAAIAGPEPGTNLEWYVLHTYSRSETKVQEALRWRIEALGMDKRLGGVLVPTGETIEMRKGKKVTVTSPLYPGYVIVQLDLNDDLWHAVKNTSKVTGFVPGGPKPVPLTASDVNKILLPADGGGSGPEPNRRFMRNDRVDIIDSPFAGFSGSVEEVSADCTTLKVMVTIFGRATPIQLEYYQVKKAS